MDISLLLWVGGVAVMAVVFFKVIVPMRREGGKHGVKDKE